MVLFAYWLFLVPALLTLAWSGGREGRVVASACAFATGLTYLANAHFGVDQGRLPIALVDLALLLFGMTIALTSNRHWPMWFCGFQMLAVASGIAGYLFPSVFPQLYAAAAGFAAIPALGTAVLGIRSDRRGIGHAL